MHHTLHLNLFGSVRITLGGNDLSASLLSKVQALLCYLAIEQRPHSRQKIAGLLWGEMDEQAARSNLRVNLTYLRAELAPYLEITRQTLAFDPESPYWLDAAAFETHIEQSRLPNGRRSPQRLREAVALYQGPFLQGLEVRDAPLFEEWVLQQRTRYERLVIEALDMLVDLCIEQQRYEESIGYARRLLAFDNWREETHRQLMWLLEITGQHSAALAQFEACREILATELDVEPTQATQRLYEKILRRRERRKQPPKELPPLPEETAVPPIPFQAPPKVLHFTGRREEMAALQETVLQAAPRTRLALTGLGGIGKTTLAVHLAHTLADHFPDGVLWTNAATADPKVVAESWGAAYGYDFSSLDTLEKRAAALRRVLAERRAFLVFDDLSTAARIEPLLPDQGESVVCLTTRSVQVARRLGSSVVHVNELSLAAGIRLLTRIVGEERVNEESSAAREICELLQNLPLALTLAGRHLAHRERRRLDEYLVRLRSEHDRLDLLQLGNDSVRASFAISWQGLDDTQKRVFRLLGVFDGRSFPAEALAAVSGLEHYIALDRLDDLVKLSLVTAVSQQRYQQHALLADFALEQLHDGGSDHAFLRMARYYLAYAQQHRDDYAALRPEWENLTASIEAAHRLRQWQMVLEFTAALRQAWFARGRFTEAREAYQWAREAAMAVEDEYAYANTLLNWGRACIEQNDYATAEEMLCEALTYYQDLHAADAEADVHYELARLYLEQDAFDQSAEAAAAAQQIRHNLGDRAGEAAVIYTGARLAYRHGDYAEAYRLANRALAMQEKAEDTAGSCRTLRLLSYCLLGLDPENSLDEAEGHYRRAVALAEALHDRGELAAGRSGLANICRRQGQLEEAKAYALESLSLHQSIGARRSEALVLYGLSRIYADMHAYDEALEHAQRSLSICDELDARTIRGHVLLQKGDILQEMNEDHAARAAWSEVLKLGEALGHDTLQAEALRRLHPPANK